MLYIFRIQLFVSIIQQKINLSLKSGLTGVFTKQLMLIIAKN